jgi:hypothetical protein
VADQPRERRNAWSPTNLLTFVIKVSGLAIALFVTFAPTDQTDPTGAYAIAAFMMAGAQATDAAIDYIKGRKP